MSGIEVTAAGPMDAEVLAEVHSQATDEPWDGRTFAGHLAIPGTVARLAGFAGNGAGGPGGLVLARVAGDDLEVLTVAVVPEARRRGLGRRLLSATIAAGRELGARRLVLEVAVDNTAARALYAGFALTPVGRRVGYYRRDAVVTDGLILAADLNPEATAVCNGRDGRSRR